MSVDIVAKLAQLETDLGKAVRMNERAAAEMQRKWDAAGKAIGSAMAALGGAAALTAVVGMTGRIIDGVDALNDFADATGLTVEAASQLEDLALRTGTSLDVAQTAVTKLNKALSDGNPDSDTAKTLKAIGVSAEELRTLAPELALQKVADALGKYSNDGNKARIVQELFGKSLKEVAPLLKDLAENGLQAATVTSKQADEAERLNKSFFELQKNTLDLARNLTGPLVSGLNDVIERIQAASKAFGGLGKAFLALNPLGDGDRSNSVQALQDYQKELGNITARVEKLKGSQSDNAPVRAAQQAEIAALTERSAKVQKLVGYYSSLLKLSDGSAGGGRGSGGDSQNVAPDISAILAKDPKAPKAPKAGKARKDDLPLMLVDLPEDVAKARAAIEKLIGDTPIMKAEQLAEQLKQLQILTSAGFIRPEVAEQLKAALEGPDQILEAATEKTRKLREELDKLFDDSVEGKTNRFTVLLEEAKRGLDDGTISAERYGATVRKIAEGLAALQDKNEEVAAKVSTFWDQAQRNIQDSLGQGLVDILDGNFQSIGKSFERMLKNMAAQAIAADLANSLFGSADKSGARSGGGWIDQGISWLASTFGGGRAAGGAVGAGQFYEVNEKAPELLNIGQRTLLMMGSQSGSVVPLGAGGGSMGGGQSVIVNQSFTVGDVVSSQQLYQVADQVRRAAIAGVNEARMRRGLT